MKKITHHIIILFSSLTIFQLNAQITETFDTFTLSPNSYYQNSNGNDWKTSPTSPVTFEYGWENSLWKSGSSYTNMKDTTDVTSNNLYGCAAYTAFDGEIYATVKDSAKVYFLNNSVFLSSLSGFFVTNTAYVKNIIKNGGVGFRKFGDTTGLGWGTSIPQGEYPDWFKLSVYGYKGGVVSSTLPQIYLADYRPAGTVNDFIVKDWRYINCTSLGMIDSVQLILESTDKDINGKMKTPGYFSIDHLTIQNNVGIVEFKNIANIQAYPNPTLNDLTIKYLSKAFDKITIQITDISGKEILSKTQETEIGPNTLTIETKNFDAGLYFIIISDGNSKRTIKLNKI